jgi:hypothetical protein
MHTKQRVIFYISLNTKVVSNIYIGEEREKARLDVNFKKANRKKTQSLFIC